MTSENKARILLSAFGIHTGGGMVLLRALITALQGNLKLAALDARIQCMSIFEGDDVRVVYVRKSFLARLLSLFRLIARSESDDVLFCFNSLPPLWRAPCRVITYVQAPHFANMHYGFRYTFLTAVRIWIERQWFKLGVKNSDELWVQTLTMANEVRIHYPNVKVFVVPFVDDDLAEKLSSSKVVQSDAKCDASEYIFFYPADGVGHKNHVNLLMAWVILNNRGHYPKLILTLVDEEVKRISAMIGEDIVAIKNVINLGRISRDIVFDQMASSSAMIFPSLAETFGLPMLEARSKGVAIIASEKDFVRDVCAPVESFDPSSPRSIAAAVERFMQCQRGEMVDPVNADNLCVRLLNKHCFLPEGDGCQSETGPDQGRS